MQRFVKNAPRGSCHKCGAEVEEHWHRECKRHRAERIDRRYHERVAAGKERRRVFENIYGKKD